MKITYDPDADAMMVHFNDARIRESDEITPNVIADFGDDGEVIGIEILDASRLVTDPRSAIVEILAPGTDVR
jgi:uncharacterized protein YuzE